MLLRNLVLQTGFEHILYCVINIDAFPRISTVEKKRNKFKIIALFLCLYFRMYCLILRII
jgi:hypothetical protein